MGDVHILLPVRAAAKSTSLLFLMTFHRLTTIVALTAAFIAAADVPVVRADTEYEELSITQLENRLADIQSELGGLAQYSLRSGIGAIGYRSQTHEDADHTEWIEVELEHEMQIDEVVLVPNLLRDPSQGFRAEGFPLEFKVIVKGTTDDKGLEVASYSAENNLLPRIAPLVIPLDGITASHVRIEASRLTPRQLDGRFLLQFAEILIFSGNQNVALRRPLECSTDRPTGSAAWNKRFANDGFMPYFMNCTGGEKSRAFVCGVKPDEETRFQIDLIRSQQLTSINLHLVDQSDTVPQEFSGNFGVPGTLIVEGSQTDDFSDAIRLAEIEQDNIVDIGPIITVNFPATDCRYVRLTAVDPYVISNEGTYAARLGFAEIECIAEGVNVALGREVILEHEHARNEDTSPLTDGNNFFGRILPGRMWLEQLARRHDLEAERPVVQAELNLRYQRQRTNLNRLMWLAAGLALVALGAVVVGWNLRQRAIIKTRERIAADLHDELGANIHAIGLLSDLAQASSESPEKLKPLMHRMREFTERAGTAAKFCANMIESQGLYDDLANDMRHSAARLLADLEHELEITGEEHLDVLKPRHRIDLFLFYKECLTNIIRHSGADKVRTVLNAAPEKITLDVSDNGQGLSPLPQKGVPSLRRRARLLGGRISTEHASGGGTTIKLVITPGRSSLLGKLGIG
ncbi:MAG: ATP-binding protein [Planctomycetota bacterium]